MEKKRSNTYRQGLFVILALMLVFAPVFRASNLPLPLMVLELLSLVALAFLLIDTDGLKKSTALQLGLSAALVAIPLLFLLPLPAGIWEMMPGRAAFLPAITAAGNETGPRSLSIVSHLSENALWALIPAVVVFTATINLSRHQVMRLVYIVIGIAIFQSILGLMQFGGGPGSPLYFGS